MKKIKLSIKKNSPIKTIHVFSTIEDAQSWLLSDQDDPEKIDNINNVETVVLAKEEFLEVELRGYEYVNNKNSLERFNYVRFAKIIQPKNTAGLLISAHQGWVTNSTFAFKEVENDEIISKNLDPESSTIDLDSMFVEEEEEEANDSEEDNW